MPPSGTSNGRSCVRCASRQILVGFSRHRSPHRPLGRWGFHTARHRQFGGGGGVVICAPVVLHQCASRQEIPTLRVWERRLVFPHTMCRTPLFTSEECPTDFLHDVWVGGWGVNQSCRHLFFQGHRQQHCTH